MTIGDRIKEYRVAKGWTQERLAKESSLNRNSIYKYEKNETMPRMPQARAIAEALGITYEGLMSGKESVTVGADMTASTGGFATGTTDITLAKQRMNADFDTLNSNGKREAAKRVHELTLIPEYKE